MHYAAYCNDPDDVRAQLSLGVPVDIRDDNGWTPLHWSIDMAQAWGEPEQVVSLLLKAGASANAVDNSGFSVMMMACGRNNEAIFEQLIVGGANIAIQSVMGTTARRATISRRFVTTKYPSFLPKIPSGIAAAFKNRSLIAPRRKLQQKGRPIGRPSVRNLQSSMLLICVAYLPRNVTDAV